MKVVVIYGSPGAGKGMQATLLERHHDFIHFDTGRYIEHKVHDPDLQKDPIIKRERKLFDSGFLDTPSWVFKIVKDEVTRMSRARENIVFSGSPRTLYEAEHLVPLFEKLYGRKNIKFFSLVVPQNIAIKRNVARRICSVCGAVMIDPDINHKHCPICTGKLVKRIFDNRESLVRRFEQYTDRTRPIFEYLKKRKYKVIKIDGTLSPKGVFDKLSKHL